ncbi:MAG: pilus assembly protein PilM, partial [bacterium]
QSGTESELLDLALILSNKFTKQKADSDTQPDEGLEDLVDLLIKSEAPPEPAQLKFDINEECLNLFDDVNFDSEEEKDDLAPTLENELGELEFSLDENINNYRITQEESNEDKIDFTSNSEEIATPVILSEELHNETQEEENKAIDSAKESEKTSTMPISSAKKMAQLNAPNEAGKTGENEDILSEPTDTNLESEVQKPEKDFTNMVMDEHHLDQKDESEIPVREADEPFVFSKKVLSQGANETQKSSRAKQQTKIPPTANRRKRSKKQSFITTSFSLTSLIENTKLLGLDIGSNSLKYVILKKTTRGLKLIDCGMRSIAKASVDASEQEKRALIVRTIRKKFKIQSVKNTLVTSAVSGLEVLYQNIQVPKMARKELAKAVPWACRKDFPFPIDATIFEYQIIDHTNGKFNIFVEAAQKDLVTNHVQMLQNAKIGPAKVSTVPVALWNLFRAVVKKQADKCHAVIDIGGSSSHIVFINHGQLLFAREISTAGDDITHALTGSIFIEGQEIHVSPERAERFKRKYGILDKDNDDNAEDNIPLKEISVMMAPV